MSIRAERARACVSVCEGPSVSQLTVVRQLAVGFQTPRLVQVVLQDDVGFVVLKKSRGDVCFLDQKHAGAEVWCLRVGARASDLVIS